jgi:hypothetical protein
LRDGGNLRGDEAESRFFLDASISLALSVEMPIISLLALDLIDEGGSLSFLVVRLYN